MELKGPSVARTTVRLLEKAIRDQLITPDQIIFSSYNLPTLQTLRQGVGPRFKISVMLTPQDLALSQMYPNWPQAEQNAYYVPFSMQALQRNDIHEIQPDFLHIEHSNLTKESLDGIKEQYPKAKIILWCAGETAPNENPEFIDTILEFYKTKKLFAVITDFPEMMQAHLSEQGLKITLPDNL